MTPVVPPEIGRVRFDLGKTLWLWGMLVPGVVFGLASLTVETTVLSLTLGFLTLCVGLSWQNRVDCPRYFAYEHSLARDFVWNMHLRFEPSDDRADARLPPDVLRDPWLRFLERTWRLHVLTSAALVLFFLGPAAVAVCVSARTAAGMLGHWFVGYAVHAWGEQRYVVAGAKESGRNVWLLGVLAFGEGFHNNHHAFPGSARMGRRAHELDLGWGVIRILSVLRLVRDVKASREHL
jgi:fatty-acid desaturase